MSKNHEEQMSIAYMSIERKERTDSIEEGS